jgi:ABC-type branched-subunit amino acid transport system ATPase component
MLRVSGLHAFYGESHILHGVDFQVNRGEVVTLLGRNGAGRTTTLKALLGLVGRRSGSVLIEGREAIALPPHRIAHLGVGYCPEERGIYSSLSAEENLLLPPDCQLGGHVNRRNLWHVSQPEGAARHPGDATVRWRTADARRGAHLAHRGAAAAAG